MKKSFLLIFVLLLLGFSTTGYCGEIDSNIKNKIIYAIDNHYPSVEIEEFSLTSNKVAETMTEIFSEDINTFSMENNFVTYDSNNDGIIEKISFRYIFSAEETVKKNGEVNDCITDIADITKGCSNPEKVKMVYDYFIDHFEYDGTYKNYDIYSLFSENKGTCCSFSLAFRKVMKYLDIPCKIVVSKDLSHEWNKVYINDRWLNIDITNGLRLDKTGFPNARYRCYLTNDLILTNWGYKEKYAK